MKSIHSVTKHKHSVNREFPIRRALIAIMVALIATVATDGLAQGGPPRLSARDLASENTVSTNQLLTPGKALQAALRARNQLIAGHIDQAQKEITRALDISPHCALALNIQGVIHLESGQFENASEDFNNAINADSESGSAYFGLGMSLIAQHRLEKALESLDRAARLSPGSWPVYFEAALTHLGLGDTESALKQISYAERFTEMDTEKKSGNAYLRGMICINLRDIDCGTKYFEDAVAVDPNGVYSSIALRRLEQLRQISPSAK
jgi:tetratricopeptide (TPR) repeat protein